MFPFALAQFEYGHGIPAFDLLIQFYELTIFIIRNINGKLQLDV